MLRHPGRGSGCCPHVRQVNTELGSYFGGLEKAALRFATTRRLRTRLRVPPAKEYTEIRVQ